jgi:hypothetical protein
MPLYDAEDHPMNAQPTDPGMEPYLTLVETGSHFGDPESILPCQFFTPTKVSNYPREAKLWCRVLIQAASDWVKYRHSERPRQQEKAIEAERWLKGTHDSPMSYVDICERLGIDPDYLRSGILATGHTRLLARFSADLGERGMRIAPKRVRRR